MIQPSIERTATAPVEVRVSVVAGVEDLVSGASMSMSWSSVAIMEMELGGGVLDLLLVNWLCSE